MGAPDGHETATETDAGRDIDIDIDTERATDTAVADETTATDRSDSPRPAVSFVIPTQNEGEYLRSALASIAGLDTAYEHEVIVVDGGSTDDTTAIAREYDVTVLEDPDSSIAQARNHGAARANGEWLAFVDADTELRANYLTAMLGFVESNALAAASSHCRITGPLRATLMAATINYVFSRLERPILPGFNTFVHARAFEEVGGFPDVPNEDTAFSRRLAKRYPTGYYPEVLVESSGRRIATDGLTGTLWHYLRLDVGRIRQSGDGEHTPK